MVLLPYLLDLSILVASPIFFMATKEIPPSMNTTDLMIQPPTTTDYNNGTLTMRLVMANRMRVTILLGGVTNVQSG